MKRLKYETKECKENVNAALAAKSLFKQFRSDPMNQNLLWENVIETPYEYFLLIKTNDFLARKSLKVEKTQKCQIHPNTIHLSELNPMAD
jgi:hypothetical protein